MKTKSILSVAGIILALVLLAAVLYEKSSISTLVQKPAPSVVSESKTPPTTPVHTVGEVTRHAQPFLHTQVRIKGYLLKKEAGYVIFSDEPSGAISKYDLPVRGTGVDTILPNQLYLLEGVFDDTGFVASNKNPDTLTLSVPPTVVP